MVSRGPEALLRRYIRGVSTLPTSPPSNCSGKKLSIRHVLAATHVLVTCLLRVPGLLLRTSLDLTQLNEANAPISLLGLRHRMQRMLKSMVCPGHAECPPRPYAGFVFNRNFEVNLDQFAFSTKFSTIHASTIMVLLNLVLNLVCMRVCTHLVQLCTHTHACTLHGEAW